MTEERIRILQKMPIFGGVRDDILRLMLEDAAEVFLTKGDYLFEENEPGDAMYVLEEGQVAILKLCDNINYRLNSLNAGDCFGEMCLIDLGRRSASVLALTDCIAVELTNALLFKVYEKDLEQFALIQMNMGRELSRRLRIANDALYRELIKTNRIPPH
jgi:CRP/FNR family transcriptional regulator, cyclic AMP receptor protein